MALDSEVIAAEEIANGFTRQQIASTITSRSQELIILPTERCNLRCSYCYEDFAIGKMSATTQRAIELLIERRAPKLDALHLNWFGGEPLVAKDVVLRIATFAKEVCDKFGIKYQGSLTTNGYLLDRPLFEALVDARQDFFQITLDGWGEVHDAVRKFGNGRGTFSRIWQNLIQLKAVEKDFEILLRVHVRRDNIDDLPVLMRQIAKEFGRDNRFRMDFEHVRNLGGAGGATVQRPVQLKELFEIERNLRDVYRQEVDALSGGDTRRRAELEVDEAAAMSLLAAKAAGESAGGRRADEIAVGGNYICYAAKANSLLVRANGRIGKCTVALNDERNDIGRLLPDGTVEVDNLKFRPWLRGLEDMSVETLACPLKSMLPLSGR